MASKPSSLNVFHSHDRVKTFFSSSDLKKSLNVSRNNNFVPLDMHIQANVGQSTHRLKEE